MVKKLETFSWLIFILGAIFRVLGFPLSNFMIVISLSVLACLYFVGTYFLYAKPKSETTSAQASNSETFGIIGTGLGLAATIVGLLFSIQIWPQTGSTLAGAMVILALSIGFLYTKKNSITRFEIPRLIRTSIIVGVLGLVFYFIPQNSLIDVYYRQHPAYKEALKAYLEDSSNEEKRAKLDEEFERAFPEAAKRQEESSK
ncbi:MAG: hypothetical protein R2809_12225 [Flavobacteriales bacterium]